MTERILARKGQHATDWSRYGLDELCELLDEEIDPCTWEQIAAWRVMTEVCHHHANVLEKAAQQLVEHWRPAANSAASAFLRHVTDLVQSMRANADASAANARAAEGLLRAQASARNRLVGLRVELAAVKRRSRGWTALADDAHYDEMARSVMRAADREIYDARLEMSAPEDPSETVRGQPVPLGGGKPSTDFGDRGSLATSIPSPDPAMIDSMLVGDPFLARAVAELPRSAREPDSPTAPTPDSGPDSGSSPIRTSGLDSGPVLAGGPALTPAQSIGGQVAAPALTLRPSDMSNGVPTGAGMPDAAVVATTGGAAGTPGAARNTSALGARSTLPPMMTPPLTATSSGGGRSSGTVAPGGVPGNSYAARKRRIGDDGWSVKTGGRSVIEPSAEVEHEPGPGVIGVDQ